MTCQNVTLPQASGQRSGISPRVVSAAQTREGELIEVTFSPAEPQLTPCAARALLAMLVRARERADHAEG